MVIDLADVGGNVSDGIHVASVGGTWMALVHGFGGMRDRDEQLAFHPRLPERMTRLAFKVRPGLDNQGGHPAAGAGLRGLRRDRRCDHGGLIAARRCALNPVSPSAGLSHLLTITRSPRGRKPNSPSRGSGRRGPGGVSVAGGFTASSCRRPYYVISERSITRLECPSHSHPPDWGPFCSPVRSEWH